jgi:predicted enzyme related to lactoylglutathione lyase
MTKEPGGATRWTCRSSPRTRRGQTHDMNVDVLFTGVAVTDSERARAWYAQLFGREADIVAAEEEALWKMTETGWVYVVGDAPRAGNALVALAVPDLDHTISVLKERGVPIGPAEPEGDAGRKATALDPDGNSIAFIEVASGG